MTSSASFEVFTDASADPLVRGFLHRPVQAHDGLVLTHGAGGNCKGPWLVALAEAFASAGVAVLRCDLPFRQSRSFGPPRPSKAARDRQGLKTAVAAVRKLVRGRIFLGGHSYGGRQGSILSAEEPDLVQGLVLSSYPLHPPGKTEQLRTAHFPKLAVPVLFVQGTRDPFGSVAEMEAALQLITSPTFLLQVDGVGHDLGFKGKTKLDPLPATVVTEFEKLCG